MHNEAKSIALVRSMRSAEWLNKFSVGLYTLALGIAAYLSLVVMKMLASIMF